MPSKSIRFSYGFRSNKFDVMEIVGHDSPVRILMSQQNGSSDSGKQPHEATYDV